MLNFKESVAKVKSAPKDVEHISIVWANPHTPSVDSPPSVDSKNAKKKSDFFY